MASLTQMVSRVGMSVPLWRRASPRLPSTLALCWGGGQSRGMAGHSKWANIRHTKALKDAQKQKVMTKCLQMVRVAIKEGGNADPKLNSKLARVIEYASSQNIPSATIVNTVKQAQKSQDNAKSMFLEYRAPGGLLLLVEVLTNNLLRTRANMRSVIKKTSFQEVKGSVHRVFDEKGVVVAVAGKGAKVPTLEEALDLAIEIGAEEVENAEEEEGKGRFLFTCAPDVFLEVKKGVEERGYEVTYASIDFIPNVSISLPEDEAQKLEAVIEKLEAVDDVMRVHVNL